MSIRNIKLIESKSILHLTTYVQVKYNSDIKEYYCVLTVNGVRQSDSTYYTDDKQDALGTAKAMLERVIGDSNV